jgi:hypothetical protein
MTRLLLLLVFVLLAPVTAQGGRRAVAHSRQRAGEILKELQRSLDAKDDPEVATQIFCESGRGLQKP